MFDVSYEWDPPERLKDGAVEMLLAFRLRPRAENLGPVRAIAVVDRSGSMAGDHLACAARSVESLRCQLAPSDWITVVSFADDVKTEFDGSVPTYEQPRIDALKASGASLLPQALAYARALAMKDESRSSFIAVFTDCQPTTTAGRRLLDRTTMLETVRASVGAGVPVALLPIEPRSRWGRHLSEELEGAGARVITAAGGQSQLGDLAASARRRALGAREAVELELAFAPEFELRRAALVAPVTRSVGLSAPVVFAGPTTARLSLGMLPPSEAVLLLDVVTHQIFGAATLEQEVGQATLRAVGAATSRPPIPILLRFVNTLSTSPSRPAWVVHRSALDV